MVVSRPKDGMIKQMNALSNMGLISCFIGMLPIQEASYPSQDTNISEDFM
jgi:glucuronate isomerase